MINKLEIYSTSDDGIWQKNHPTKEDFMDKINEIIDAINILLKEKEDDKND